MGGLGVKNPSSTEWFLSEREGRNHSKMSSDSQLTGLIRRPGHGTGRGTKQCKAEWIYLNPGQMNNCKWHWKALRNISVFCRTWSIHRYAQNPNFQQPCHLVSHQIMPNWHCHFFLVYTNVNVYLIHSHIVQMFYITLALLWTYFSHKNVHWICTLLHLILQKRCSNLTANSHQFHIDFTFALRQLYILLKGVLHWVLHKI